MKNVLLFFAFKKNLKSLLLISFLALQGMDYPDHKAILDEYTQGLKKKCETPVFKKKIQLWNPDQWINDGIELKRSAPRSIIIVPDDLGIIYALPGQVCFVSKSNITTSNPHVLYTHSEARYYPLIAAAITPDRKLKIVSIMNKIKQKPECIISVNKIGPSNNKSHNIFKSNIFNFLDIGANVKTTGLHSVWEDANVQSVRLSSNGEYLSIALGNKILTIDLVTETSNYSNFVPYTEGSFVVDVSVPVSNFLNPHEKHLAAVNDQGIIDFKKLSKVSHKIGSDGDNMLTNVKNAPTGDRIENIHLMKEAKEMWYVTEKGQVKTINFRIFIEHCEKDVQKRIVSYHEGSRASIDQSSEHTIIHWVENPLLADDLRLQMNVYRESSTGAESFVINISDLLGSPICNFITAEGQKTSLATHILLAAIRGNSVVAITTEGIAYFWKLPEMYRNPTEEDVRADIRSIKTMTRQRSLSSPALPEDVMRKVGRNGDERRKSGKRSSQVPKLNIFKSRESLKETGSSSPTESPRKKPGTPRRKSSMPAHAATDASKTDRESRYEAARRADIINDFTRKTDS